MMRVGAACAEVHESFGPVADAMSKDITSAVGPQDYIYPCMNIVVGQSDYNMHARIKVVF